MAPVVLSAVLPWLTGLGPLAALIAALGWLAKFGPERRSLDATSELNRQQAHEIALDVAGKATLQMQTELGKRDTEIVRLQGALTAAIADHSADVARLEAALHDAERERDGLRRELEQFKTDMQQRPLPDGEPVDRRRGKRGPGEVHS